MDFDAIEDARKSLNTGAQVDAGRYYSPEEITSLTEDEIERLFYSGTLAGDIWRYRKKNRPSTFAAAKRNAILKRLSSGSQMKLVMKPTRKFYEISEISTEGSTRKRPRDHGDSPEEGKCPKRKKSYKDALTQEKDNTELVAVLHSEYPMTELTKRQISAVKKGLTKAMLPCSPDDTRDRPQVWRTLPRRSYLLLVCNKDVGMEWLEDEVKKLTPWEGASLVVKRGEDVPKGTICTALVLHEDGESVPEEQVLVRISTLNSPDGITGKGWKIVGKSRQDNGDLYFFEIEPGEYEALKAVDYTVFFGLGTLKITPQAEESSTEKVEDETHV